jgi:hypothetical protein
MLQQTHEVTPSSIWNTPEYTGRSEPMTQLIPAAVGRTQSARNRLQMRNEIPRARARR